MTESGMENGAAGEALPGDNREQTAAEAAAVAAAAVKAAEAAVEAAAAAVEAVEAAEAAVEAAEAEAEAAAAAEAAVGDQHIRLTPNEVAILNMFRAYSQAVTLDTHVWLQVIDMSKGDPEKTNLGMKGILSSHAHDVHFMGLLLASSGRLMSAELKVEAKALYEKFYRLVINQISYEFIENAKKLQLEKPPAIITEEPKKLQLVSANGELLGSQPIN